MIELKGRYGIAKVFTNTIDEATENQIKELMDSHLSDGSTVRIMPDTHAGAGNVIGLTMTAGDKVSPDLIGSDIGCGISLYQITLGDKLDLMELDQIIKSNVPYGYFKRVLPPVLLMDFSYLDKLMMLKDPSVDKNQISLAIRSGYATLGGGNHFIEAYEESDNSFLLSVHTGSRTLGGLVYKYYNTKTKNRITDLYHQQRESIIRKLKFDGKSELIQSELDKHKNLFTDKYKNNTDIKYLEGVDLENYTHDMVLVNRYARENRKGILLEIVNGLKAKSYVELMDKPHNFLEVVDGISYLRKGSQSAYSRESVLIPINMRDGVIVGVAKGNPDWNYSFPHGAGRVLSRTQAKSQLNLEEFIVSMKDVYTTTANLDTIDESPKAYKTLESILENIKDELLPGYKILKPIYNFKGGSENYKPTDDSK